MAHELEILANGEASMAFVGDRKSIWHGLGFEVPDNLTPGEIMAAAKLDWTVEKVPAYVDVRAKDEQMFTRQQTGTSALVRDRDGKILDMVSNDWEPLQNVDAFDFFNDFISQGDMKMDTCGSLRGGKIVWAMAKVNENFTVFGGDKVEAYMLLSSPHEYGRTIDVRFVATRTVCANTLAVALAENAKQKVKVNHRKKFDASEVKNMLGIGHQKMDHFKEIAEMLGGIKYTQDMLDGYFKSVFPITTSNENDKNKLSLRAKEAMSIVETQPGAEFAPGSLWNAFNAVSFLTSNVMGRDAETRMYNQFYGSNQSVVVNALNSARQLALAA